MELAEEEARKKEFTSLVLYTHQLMAENIELYKRFGYVETDWRTEKGYPRVYIESR